MKRLDKVKTLDPDPSAIAVMEHLSKAVKKLIMTLLKIITRNIQIIGHLMAFNEDIKLVESMPV